MVVGMLLAHLVGDFIMQWDRLAAWKSREVRGALVHGTVVLAVTWLISLFFDPTWWRWVLFIGLSHAAIDACQPLLLRRLPPTLASRTALPRFLLDQLLHLLIILYALAASGATSSLAPLQDLMLLLQQNRLLAFVLGYAFLSMPAWILIEFLVYGLLRGSSPDLQSAPNRYLGALERVLIATFVIFGQFVLVPLAGLPRLLLERPQVRRSPRRGLYVAEILGSTLLAIGTGLALRGL
jgi:hypothetical protein